MMKERVCMTGEVEMISKILEILIETGLLIIRAEEVKGEVEEVRAREVEEVIGEGIEGTKALI